MSDLKILANMSPSGIGDYATCPMKAVFDADYPKIEKPEWQCYSNFGKVCHWTAQYMMGAVPKEDRPEQAVWDSAQTTPDVPNTTNNFLARVELCASVANEVVRNATPLPPGVTWKGEVKAYNREMLPKRVGRKGDVCGFGGSIDLAASDKSVLWDYKFVGAKKVPGETDINPKFRPDAGMIGAGNAGIKNTYVWQCGSYHILTKIPKTNIAWVGRDGKARSFISINWDHARGASFATRIEGFLKFVDTPYFRDVAWPVRGETCDNCSHKDRCPAWSFEAAKNPGFAKAVRTFSALEALMGEAGVIPASTLPPPPPPPPVAARQAFIPPPPPPPSGAGAPLFDL